MTDLWLRNPHNYIREVAEVGFNRVIWDRGILAKRKIDPIKHAQIYFKDRHWRIMLCGEQGTAEYTSDSPNKPVGVYSTWDASCEDLVLLEEMMQYPLGEDIEACDDMDLPDDVRPILGQVHRVVVINVPQGNKMQGRALIRQLKELQDENPDCILHIHGFNSWRFSFGLGFRGTDVDPRTLASKGRVTLPSGKNLFAEQTVKIQQWITMLGMTSVQLMKEPRNRCIYNIKSAIWASEHFMDNLAFKSMPSTKNMPPPDFISKRVSPATVKKNSPFTGPVSPQPNDKINCDTCSLQDKCKYYRQGSVCSVPGSEPAELAKHFKTRDADQIIDGLGTLMALQARRLDRGVADENMYGELNPEVTKIANQIFTNGAKLAKLVDPGRFAGPSVQVNVGNGNASAIQASTPNQVLGAIVRELENRGIPRDKITGEMVQNLMAEMGNSGGRREIVESTVISNEES